MSNFKKPEKTGKEEVTIQITKDGPYLISGKVPISEQIITVNEEGVPGKWQQGKQYPIKEKCGLCRCGQSQSKPYCDGSHIKAGFDGTETSGFEPSERYAETYDGPALKLVDAEWLCASARFCHRNGEIWNLIPKSDEPQAKQAAIGEACDCPSGRLTIVDKQTGEPLEPTLPQAIGLVEDPQVECSGPLWVQGGIPIKSADGKTYEVRNRVTLCRCGKSTIKPFCDSSHFPEHKYQEIMATKEKTSRTVDGKTS
jgi:CDGSH-type Zn-finger protein